MVLPHSSTSIMQGRADTRTLSRPNKHTQKKHDHAMVTMASYHS